uniref:Uncharacterized protein n=1 Tax=Arundo donax TaxID=35708 RepID=A0A0A9FG48_ARUDO
MYPCIGFSGKWCIRVSVSARYRYTYPYPCNLELSDLLNKKILSVHHITRIDRGKNISVALMLLVPATTGNFEQIWSNCQIDKKTTLKICKRTRKCSLVSEKLSCFLNSSKGVLY